MKAASLIEVYQLAKQYTEFMDFEHELKSKFTGRPITEVIDCCDLILVDKSKLQELIDNNKKNT